MKKETIWQEKGRVGQPFKVPDGYFNQFEDRMIERIKREEKNKNVRFLTPRLVRWVSGVAAVLLVGFIGFQQLHLKPQQIKMDQEVMYAVIEFYAQDLDEESLALMMAESNVFEEEEEEEYSDGVLLDYMNVEELEIIEAIVDGN